MTSTAFQPSILLSSPSLARFLSGDAETAVILETSHPSTLVIQGGTCDEIYSYFVGFFQGLTSYLMYAICMADLSKRLWIEALHTLHNATAIKTQNVFQNSLLVHSVNTHRKDTADYFLQDSLQTPSGVMHFFHWDGVCRGMCHWFIHLYFKTHAQMTDADEHLRAVGKQFELGAPRQAAFLQSLEPFTLNHLLHLNVTMDYCKFSMEGKTEDQIIEELQLLPPGVYGIYTAVHQVVYIKVDQFRQYLFDPNRGVIKLATAAVFKNIMQRYFETHDFAKEIYIDLYVSD